MPDAPPINLIQLREQIAAQASELEVDYYPIEHDALLALIDTAEAARALDLDDVLRGYGWWYSESNSADPDYEAIERLRESLARYTQTDD